MTTPTDWRALCNELLEALENAIRVIHHEDGTKHISAVYPVLNKTKAALAQTEPQGPTDRELTLTYARAVAAAVDGKRAPFSIQDAEAAQLAGLRAVLDRLGGSAPCPYVVSSDEGTSYCRLAEHTADQLAKLLGEGGG